MGPPHLEALEEARNSPLAQPLAALVAFEVSIVTGANDFFSVDDETLADYALEPWETDAGFILTCQSHPTTDHVVVDYDAV